MTGTESPVESIKRNSDLRKELGKKWGAAIVGLPARAAIYLMSKNAGSGETGEMNIEATSIGIGTEQGRGIGLSARDPYESEYQRHKQTVGGGVSFRLSDYSNIESDPPSSAPSRSIEISIFKEASQIVFDEYTAKATTRRADLSVGSDGMARLRLLDDSDKAGVVAAVSRGEPVVILTGAPLKSRLDLFVKGGATSP